VSGDAIDLSPSMHWPTPVPARDIHPDRGPVLVTVEYRIPPADRASFLAGIGLVAGERKRDGAYDWGVYEDIAGRRDLYRNVSRRFPGWSICGNTSGSPTPTAWSSKRFCAFHTGSSPPVIRHFVGTAARSKSSHVFRRRKAKRVS